MLDLAAAGVPCRSKETPQGNRAGSPAVSELQYQSWFHLTEPQNTRLQEAACSLEDAPWHVWREGSVTPNVLPKELLNNGYTAV